MPSRQQTSRQQTSSQRTLRPRTLRPQTPFQRTPYLPIPRQKQVDIHEAIISVRKKAKEEGINLKKLSSQEIVKFADGRAKKILEKDLMWYNQKIILIVRKLFHYRYREMSEEERRETRRSFSPPHWAQNEFKKLIILFHFTNEIMLKKTKRYLRKRICNCPFCRIPFHMLSCKEDMQKNSTYFTILKNFKNYLEDSNSPISRLLPKFFDPQTILETKNFLLALIKLKKKFN